MPSECDHVEWGWESCQYDSQCIFIDYMSQTKSVKKKRMTFTCASGNTALSDECGWTFSLIILLRFGRTPTLGGKGCQWQISWDALADVLRVPVHQCILPFSNHEHNTQEKHWVSYWIMIAALQAISCQLSWRFTDAHSHQNNKQHTEVLCRTHCYKLEVLVVEVTSVFMCGGVSISGLEMTDDSLTILKQTGA